MPNVFSYQPLQDESTYSVLSRIHIQSGERSPLMTLKSWTGLRGYKPLSGLPTHIDKFSQKLGINGGSQQLIKLHTHLPLYAHFIAPDRYKFVLEAMIGDGSPKSRLGLLRSDVQAKENLRFCPECYKFDIETYGVAYWHREHLLPGVHVCDNHNEYLLEIDTKGLHGERMLSLPEGGRYICDDVNIMDKLKYISNQFKMLLMTPSNASFNSTVYRHIVNERGLNTKHDHVRQRELTQLMKNWLFPLKKICIFRKILKSLNVDRNWAAQLVSGRDGFHHPLKHVVLWGALGADVQEIRNTAPSFGEQLELDLCMIEASDITKKKLESAISKYKTLSLSAYYLNVSVTTLSVMADIYGISYKRRPKIITQNVKDDIHEYFKNGYRASSIALKTGLSVASVNRVIRILKAIK